MSIPFQFAFLYDGQEVFVWSDCLLDLGTDLLVGNMVFAGVFRAEVALTEYELMYTNVEWIAQRN